MNCTSTRWISPRVGDGSPYLDAICNAINKLQPRFFSLPTLCQAMEQNKKEIGDYLYSSVPYPVAFGHCFALAFDASHSPLLLVKDLARRCGVANGKGCNSAKALKGAPPPLCSISIKPKPPLSEYFINLLCGCQFQSSPVQSVSLAAPVAPPLHGSRSWMVVGLKMEKFGSRECGEEWRRQMHKVRHLIPSIHPCIRNPCTYQHPGMTDQRVIVLCPSVNAVVT